MGRADLVRFAILSLPTDGQVTKRQLCISGHLANLLVASVRAGEEKEVLGTCAKSELMSHLYNVLTSFKSTCPSDHSLYHVAVACVSFLCANEEFTRLLLMKDDDDAVRWMTCLSRLLQTTPAVAEGSIRWVVCLSDGLLVTNYMLSVAGSTVGRGPPDEVLLKLFKVIHDEEALQIAFSCLFDKEVPLCSIRDEAICRMTAVLIHAIRFACIEQTFCKDVDEIIDRFFLEQKVFGFVGLWLCSAKLNEIQPGCIIGCSLLASLAFLIGPKVNQNLKTLVQLRVSSFLKHSPSNAIVTHCMTDLGMILSKYESTPADLDMNLIMSLLPSPFETLVHVLDLDLGEDFCCSWCGRSEETLSVCPTCQQVQYCSAFCQLAHGLRHQRHCKYE